MSQGFKILICDHFKAETEKILSSGDFDDISPLFFLPRCGIPPTKNNDYDLCVEFPEGEPELLVCKCNCLTVKSPNNSSCSYHYLDNCFFMFYPKNLLEPYIVDGCYIITPGWLTIWQQKLAQYGEANHVRQMFAETTTKLVLLDTEISAESNKQLIDMSEYLKIPHETIKVGLDYFRLLLTSIITKKRLDIEQKKNTKAIDEKNALVGDYLMAMNLLSELPHQASENYVIDGIMNLLNMLFAPDIINILSFRDNNIPAKVYSNTHSPDNDVILGRLSKLKKNTELTQSKKGFLLRVGSQEKKLAVIEVDNLKIPKYVSNYQNLALAMANVFALAIENSRFYEQILQDKEIIRQSGERFQSLFEQAPLGVGLFNYSANRFVRVNTKYCEILQYYPEEIYMMDYMSIIYPEDQRNVKHQAGQLIRNKIKNISIEIQCIRKNKSLIWVKHSIMRIRYGDDKSDYLIIMIEDITEKKRNEQLLLRNINLESLGILAGGIAHDFNNLLTVIMGNAEILLYDCEKEHHIKMLKQVMESSEAGAVLANQILTFSKGGNLPKSIVSIRKTIKEATYKTLTDSSISPQFSFTENLSLEANQHQIDLVIQNIVRNAWEFSTGIGKIFISTQDVQLEDGLFIKIDIEDEGNGIPYEIINKIFEPYFSTKPMGTDKGRGLGLSVCYSIIKKHGGKISVQSEVNKGTTFSILLPAIKNPNEFSV